MPATWPIHVSRIPPFCWRTATSSWPGGYNGDGPNELTSAELFHPATGTWAATGSMTEARAGPTTTLFNRGEALTVGGVGLDQISLATAEIYDPATGSWTATASELHSPRDSRSTLRLLDGTVLIAAGIDRTGPTTFTHPAGAEAYEPRRR